MCYNLSIIKGCNISNNYKHTQIGYALVFILLLALIFIVTIENGEMLALSITAIVALIVFATFSALTVQIKDGFIELRFGIGTFIKKIALKDVVLCKVVRNPWYYSLGIHMIPNGFIYNVSGLNGVELTMKNGRIIRIGTDQPQALESAIKQVV